MDLMNLLHIPDTPSNILVTDLSQSDFRLFPKATRCLEPISYRGAILSTLVHATVYVTHNLLNVLVQIANKMGLQKKRFQTKSLYAFPITSIYPACTVILIFFHLVFLIIFRLTL
jgi:hypothetical protein